MRRLSSQRDNFRVVSRQSILSPSELIDHITQAADKWADATAFLSPAILIELVQHYQNELVAYFRTLDLEAESRIPVNWAGQAVSTNWFDIAREYTERWHHQMQIREALGKPAILDRELYHPVLDTFMQALPHHYRDINASDGYILEVHISGESGGSWFLQWNGPMRELKSHVYGKSDTTVTLEPGVAWKVFTRFNKSMYDKRIQVEGDNAMGSHLLEMKCVMVE